MKRREKWPGNDPVLRIGFDNHDPEDNPHLEKHFLLLSGDVDKETAKTLTPIPNEIIRIQKVVELPDFEPLSTEDSNLIWRFRYSLIDLSENFRGKALVKLLRLMKFEKKSERDEVMQILKDWPKLVLEDAIPLISTQFAANRFDNTLIAKSSSTYMRVFLKIRQKAIECLDEQPWETLKLIMVQLV